VRRCKGGKVGKWESCKVGRWGKLIYWERGIFFLKYFTCLKMLITLTEQGQAECELIVEKFFFHKVYWININVFIFAPSFERKVDVKRMLKGLEC